MNDVLTGSTSTCYWRPDEINKETEIAHTNSTIGAIVIKFSSIYHTKSDFNKHTL